MTKLKNTKKGMAKKALSVSLVAAMLATSNVPVWAAEDLFSDGSAAVEAPAVVEEPAAEVQAFSAEPVEENNTSATLESSTSGNQYSAAITAFKYNGKDVENNSIVWGEGELTTTLTVTKNSNIDGVIGVYAVWKAGNDVVTEPAELTFNSDGTYTLDCFRNITKDDANKSLSLYVYAKKADGTHAWTYTSDSISVQAKDISSVAKASADNTEYTGEITTPTIAITPLSTGTLPEEIKDLDDYTIGYDGDRVNVTGEKVVVTLTPKSSAYKGSLTATYEITSKTLADNAAVSNVMQAKFKNTTMKYNGGKDSVKVLKDSIELIDKTSKANLSNYMVVDENGYVEVKKDSTGSYCIIPLIKGLPDNGNKNYEITGTNAVIVTSNVLEVVSRDLSSLDITINPIKGDGDVVSVEDIKGKIKIVDKETKEDLTSYLKDQLAISIPTNAVNAGTYTVTIEPVATVSKLTGKSTVTLKIFASDINAARFDNEVTEDDKNKINNPPKYYTGEAVTFSQDEIGVPKINGTPLKDSDYTIEYSNNIKAGTAKMFVIGQDSYANSIKTLEFTINKTPVTSVSRNQYVEKIDTTDPEDYKTAMGVVVKAKVPGTNKELTLVEGTDYTVEYSFTTGNKKVQAKVTLKENGNFTTNSSVNMTVTSDIVNATLKSEYIKLKEGSTFTYTGQAIEPAFDVVIGGRIIDPGQYTKEYTNNVDAGTATLTIKAAAGSNYQGTASITYTIQSAKASDLVGVIGTQEYRGYSIDIPADDIDLTLNGKKIDVAKNFTLTYGENLNIGEGTVTLTPKNSNFTGTKTLTFQITGEMLKSENATFAYRDANGFAITDKSFNYNGSAQTFAKTTLTYTGKTLKEGTDYELVYVDNVYGQKGTDNKQYAAVLAVAKGKYGGNLSETKTSGIEVKNGIYTDAEGNKTVNVFAFDLIEINQQVVETSNVTVSNGTYAAGLPTKPEVSIVVKGVKLVEGKDYDLDLSGNKDLINATTTKSLSVKIVPKNGYVGSNALNEKSFSWGIDKFDLADAEVIVNGEDVTVKCGSVDIPSSEYTVDKNGEADTITVTATEGNKNYTGSKTVSAIIETPDEKPDAPMIQEVKVSGNNATVVLSGETDGATGYDYVISTDRDCITNKDYDKVNKNILNTETTFTYTQQGVYYAYCHAWKRVNGVKVFSDWSNAYPFVVSAVTPEQPVITSVKKSGRNLTVTWTQSANATTGYDIVMGTAVRKVNGEIRPVEYGKAVKKVGPNTFSVTFKSIPKGTYYVGLHAHNRTSETGVKVFSPWSNYKTVKF